MLRFLAIGIASCLASGCFSSDALYSPEWAPRQVQEGNACPSLDGTYVNAGESCREAEFGGHEIREPRSLAHILNGGTGVESLALWNKLGETSSIPDRDLNETVRLSLAEGRLHVVATRADGSSRSLDLAVQSECRDGLLAMEGDWDADLWLIAPVAPEFSRKTLAFGRAEDGALLLREQKTATQFFLFTPAFGYAESAWIRFEPVPAPTAELAATEATP